MNYCRLLKFGLSVALLLCAHISSNAQSSSPRVFLMDAKTLIAQKRQLSDPKIVNADLKQAVAKIEREAQKALKAEFRSVDSKAAFPPSGDKHDYMSQAPYFWRDPGSKDGLPYVRRDGERNPEIDKIPDHDLLAKLINGVENLSLAYFFTGKEEYAARGNELLRMWFLDAKTRMNPNLEYAQSVPGQSAGRSFGIIETRGLPRVVDSIGLLRSSKSWNEADQKGLETWFGKYLHWLTTSKNGREESLAKNNHGTWYDVQVASFALFTGKIEMAKSTLRSARQSRIAKQIEPDGSQPLEIARTRSLSYSTMNLEAMILLAKLGDAAEVDLWNFNTPDGRSIRKAIDFLYPYASGRKDWTHKQIIKFEPERLYAVLRLAGGKYRDVEFKKMIESLPKPENYDPRAPVAN